MSHSAIRHNTGPTSLANEVVPGVLGQNTQEERGEVMRGEGGGGEVKKHLHRILQIRSPLEAPVTMIKRTVD